MAKRHFIPFLTLMIFLEIPSFSQKSKLDFGYATYEVTYKHYREGPDSNKIIILSDQTIIDFDKILKDYTSFLQFNNICSKYETTSTGSPRDFVGMSLTFFRDTYHNCLPTKTRLTEKVHKGYIEYISDDVPLVWEISQDTMVINGLKCIKATGIKLSQGHKPDNYVAWFTPDIPVPFGPINVNGLPGLILKYKWAASVVEAVDIRKLTDQKYKLVLPDAKDVISYDQKLLEAKKQKAEVLKNKSQRKN
ncbi:MAG TPA: GLPGLI family protein [Saprospiraceae bacterium]|nr:GLPGLI family protein [Saprospiraceae bacterium]